jgi:hypothetical protein
MKKLYSLALVLLVSVCAAQAQQAMDEVNGNQISLPASTLPQPWALVNDTLEPKFRAIADPFCDTISIYCSVNTHCRYGYRTGNNQFNDREKLTKYYYPQSGTVQAAFFRCGGKKMANGTSPTYAVVYGVGSDGLPDTNDRNLSTSVPFSRVTNGTAYTAYTFANAAIFADSFYVGMVLPTTVGDSIGIYQSRLGLTRHPAACAANSGSRSYERLADGSFVSMKTTKWNNMDAEMMMTIIVRYDNGVATKDLLTRLVKVAPVPSEGYIDVTLPANIKGATTWQILSADGKVVSQSIGKDEAAFFQVNRGTLQAGVYTLRLNTIGGPVNKRIIFAD